MKNYFTIIPGIIEWKNYFVSVRYKLTSKKLIVGRNCSLKSVRFSSHNALGENCQLNNVSLGDHSYVSSNTKINNTEIGKFCSIGPDCLIGLGTHPTDEFISTHPVFYSLSKQNGTTFADKNHFKENETIRIGNDVWIGTTVVIKDGVTIGDGAIIGAKAIVTKDVEPYSIVAGIPAKEIRKRFTPEQIAQLLEIKWWSQPEEWIKKNAALFIEKDRFFSAFIKKDSK